jgi:hypothetical protein
MVSVRSVFSLIFLIAASSFIHKDLNEYGKWRRFHDIDNVEFVQTGEAKKMTRDFHPYILSAEYQNLCRRFRFTSPDSTFFLDLDSRDISFEKDSAGALRWFGADPNQEVQLVDLHTGKATTLLSFIGDGFAETAIWRNKYLFEVCGFKHSGNKYVPTVWKYDLQENTVQEFQTKKHFILNPKSYTVEVRLKGIMPR